MRFVVVACLLLASTVDAPVRFIGDTVAVMQRFTQSGGGIENRAVEARRQIQVTNVLEKRNSEWKTLHQMIMDVRH